MLVACQKSCRWFSLLVGLFVAGWAVTCAGQVPQPRILTWGTSGGGSHYYGVLGEIARPGVYSSEQPVTLQALIAGAGGLTDIASPSLRIIRGQRSAQSIYFSPQGNDVLQPGDLVVADLSRRPVSSTNAPGITRPAGVWLGLIGVTSRPVIVRMLPENAHLTRLMVALKQSEQLSRMTQVIFPHQELTPAEMQGALPNASIVILPSNLLVQADLPPLPAAIPLANLAPSMAAVPPTHPRLEANVPQIPGFVPPPSAPAAMVELPLPTDQNAHRLIPAPPTLPGSPATEMVPENPRSFDRQLTASTVPFAPLPPDSHTANTASLPAPGSRVATMFPPSPATPVAPVVNPRDPDAFVLPPDENLGEPDLVGETPAVVQPARFNLWHMLGIGGTVASLVGIAIGTRHLMDQKPLQFDGGPGIGTSQPSSKPQSFLNQSRLSEEMLDRIPSNVSLFPTVSNPPPVAAPQILLDLLLQNSLPVTTEAVEYPRKVRLQRMPVPSSTTYRWDDTHPTVAPAPHMDLAAVRTEPELGLDEPTKEIPRPHFRGFKKSVEAKTPQAVHDVQKERELPVASKVRTPAFAEIQESTGQTTVERALARLQQGRRA